MKNIEAFYVICGCILAVNCAAIFNDDDGSESDEVSSPKWDLLWNDAAIGLKSMLEKECDESSVEQQTTSNKQTEENNKNGDGNAGANMNGEKFSVDHIDLLFGNMLKKLERIGKEAINEYMQSIDDLIDAFDENNDDKDTGVSEDVIKPQVIADNDQKNVDAQSNKRATIGENEKNGNKADLRGKSNEAMETSELNLDKKVEEKQSNHEEKIKISGRGDTPANQNGQSDITSEQITNIENNIGLENGSVKTNQGMEETNESNNDIIEPIKNIEEKNEEKRLDDKGNEEKLENVKENDESKVQEDTKDMESSQNNQVDAENTNSLKEEVSENGDTP